MYGRVNRTAPSSLGALTGTRGANQRKESAGTVDRRGSEAEYSTNRRGAHGETNAAALHRTVQKQLVGR